MLHLEYQPAGNQENKFAESRAVEGACFPPMQPIIFHAQQQQQQQLAYFARNSVVTKNNECNRACSSKGCSSEYNL